MKGNTAFEIPPHVVAREVGEETVILDLESGSYLGLDPVGARMWSLMGEGKTVDAVCATMLEEYEVSAEVLKADLLKLVEELTARDLLRVRQQ